MAESARWPPPPLPPFLLVGIFRQGPGSEHGCAGVRLKPYHPLITPSRCGAARARGEGWSRRVGAPAAQGEERRA